MHRLRSLTPAQWKRLLSGLLTVGVVILSFLGWTIWSSLSSIQAPIPLSSLPTPTPTLPITPTATPEPTATPTPEFDIAEAGLQAEAAAQARGQMPRWEIPLTFIDRHEMSVLLYDQYQGLPPFPQDERPLLEVLGLWPNAEIQPNLGAQADAAAALYVSDENLLYLRRDWTGAIDDLKAQLTFGYARAIPDQYGSLHQLTHEAGSFDRRLALQALADGDALFTLLRTEGVKPGTPRARELTDMIAAGISPHWRPADPELERLTQLPLKMGLVFVSARYDEGGTPAMNEAVQRPPRSTEQILHPERYTASDEPIILEPLGPTLPERWELSLIETAGEALMDLTFKQWGPAVISPTLSGWGGDLVQVWKGPAGARVVLWQTAWDSSADAQRFTNRIAQLLPTRVGRIHGTTLPAGFPKGTWWEGSLGYAFLRRSGNHVWVLWGDHQGIMKLVAATGLP